MKCKCYKKTSCQLLANFIFSHFMTQKLSSRYKGPAGTYAHTITLIVTISLVSRLLVPSGCYSNTGN